MTAVAPCASLPNLLALALAVTGFLSLFSEGKLHLQLCLDTSRSG